MSAGFRTQQHCLGLNHPPSCRSQLRHSTVQCCPSADALTVDPAWLYFFSSSYHCCSPLAPLNRGLDWQHPHQRLPDRVKKAPADFGLWAAERRDGGVLGAQAVLWAIGEGWCDSARRQRGRGRRSGSITEPHSPLLDPLLSGWRSPNNTLFQSRLAVLSGGLGNQESCHTLGGIRTPGWVDVYTLKVVEWMVWVAFKFVLLSEPLFL